MGRAARELGNVARAEEQAETLREQLAQLECEFAAEVAALARADAGDVALERVRVAPRKSDLDVDPLRPLWVPCRVGAEGVAERLVEG